MDNNGTFSVEPLTTETPSGKTIVLTAAEYLDQLLVTAELPELKIRGNLSGRAGGFLFKLPAERSGATHSFAIVGKAEIGVSAAEAERILEWLGRAESAISALPKVQLSRLREKRRMLAIDAAGAREDEQDRRWRAWERGDEESGSTWRGEKIAKADAALAAFDAAHPEVLEAIKAERAEMADRVIEHGL